MLSILFDPDGGESGNAAVQIEGLDWSVGNALAVGGNQAVSNFQAGSGTTTFQIRYQATLAGYINQNGLTIAPPGLNVPGGFEITVAALFYEQVTNVSNTGTIATASFVPAAPPMGGETPFFEIWFDSNPNASNLEGTGFRDGVRILEGVVANASGNFTTDLVSSTVLFDQFVGDDYSGQLSVVGIGGTSLTFNVVAATLDPNFFLSHITELAFNTSNKVPFSETNPSRLFFGTAPNLGAVNGGLPTAPIGLGGPDVQFQADGGTSFTLAAPAIAIKKATNGQDADTAPGPSVPLGAPVTFTYVVTNPGNEPLADVTVVDDAGTPSDPSDDFAPMFTGGDTNGNGLLDVGETWTYTATRPAHLVLGTANPRQYTNLATVTGTDPFGVVVTDNDPSNHLVLTSPAIAIKKATNGQDADTAPGPSVPLGAPVTFTYVVTNPGNEPLADVTVVDDAGTPSDPSDDFAPMFTGGDTNGNGLLDVGETWTYTATRPAHLVLGTANPCQYTNLATVTGKDVLGVAVTDNDPSNHMVLTSPGITVAKAVNGQAAEVAPGPVVSVGDTVTFTYTVRNTGDVPLSGVTLTDDAGTPTDPADDFSPTFTGGDTNGNGVLDVGETWTYTATATALAGQYANTARVSGTDPCNVTVNDTDLGHYFGTTPGIAITKVTEGPPVSVVDLRRFGFHQRPTSLVLTFSGPLDPATAENLANYQLTTAGRDQRFGTADDRIVPLGSVHYDPATRTVTLTPRQRFLWVFQNYRLVISSTPPDGVKDLSGQPLDGDGDGQAGGDFVTIFGSEVLRLAKAPTLPRPVPVPPAGALGPVVTAGSTVQFHYQVRNTGDSPLAHVTVVDDAGTPSDPSDDFAPMFTGGDTNGNGLLDVGETWTYTGLHVATAGQYVNVVTVRGTTPSGGQVTTLATSAHFGICPSVVDLVRRGVHRQPAEAVLTFNAPLNAARAEDLSHYSLVDSGPDGRFGTADDRSIPLQSAVYDPLRKTVTLTAARPLNVHGLYQITARDLCPSGPPFVGLLNRKYSLGLESQGQGRLQPTRLSLAPGGPRALMPTAHASRQALARRSAS